MKKYFSIFIFCVISHSFLFAQEQDGLKRLMDGNRRFVQELQKNPRQTGQTRELTISTQEPFAVILGCSDSRVSPEIIFDQGIGDLFVVRDAGNVISPVELESINYAAQHLGSSVILILGHQNCGAVNAVLQGQTKDIPAIARLIQPSIQTEKTSNSKDLLTASIKENAIRMKQELVKTPIIKKLIDQNKVSVYAGYYHFNTGEVEILEPPQEPQGQQEPQGGNG
jgi:carbonic anhydrase